MAGSLNKVMLIGHLGQDPEMRYLPNGTATTSFRVAATRRWNTPDGPREETEWFSIVTWAKLAEICGQSLAKGRLVYVEGRLRTRSWDGQDGQKRYRTEVVAETVTFLDSKGSRSAEATPAFDDGGIGDDTDTDEIPF